MSVSISNTPISPTNGLAWSQYLLIFGGKVKGCEIKFFLAIFM
jgi:hypothetical protein